MLHYPLPVSALLLAPSCASVAAFILQQPTQASSRRWKESHLFGEMSINDEYNPKELFPQADLQDFRLLPHRPLGMRIEESLADSKYVFVSRVEEGGLADQAGIQVGDVLVGVTGLFGDMTGSVGLGVEKM